MENRSTNHANGSTNRARTRKLTLTALFSAIIVVMTFVPYLGYIKVGMVEITTLHIPVILGGLMLGFSGSVALGTVWGITCVINALFINPIFVNPLISLVPRVLVGVVIGVVGVGLAELGLRGPFRDTVRAVITAAVGTLTNTVLVLTALGLLDTGMFPTDQTIVTIFATIVGTNGIIELALAVFLTPALFAALRKVRPTF